MPRTLPHILARILLLPAFLFGLAACDDRTPEAHAPDSAPAPDMSEPDSASGEDALAATIAAGQIVYEENCVACHEGGVARAPHRTMLEIMSPVSVHESMVSGVMQDQAAHLSDREKRDVSAFLTGQSVESAVANVDAAMCAPDKGWFDFNATPWQESWGFDHQGSRFIPENVANLTTDEVGSLKLKWVFAYPGANRARSQPSFAGGALFVGSHDGTVYALDEETGCIRWTFKASAEVRTHITVGPWDAGDGDARPLAYFGDLVGNVYAIDARTGDLAWRMRASDHANATITAAPTLYDDRLYVAVSSLEVATAADPEYECCTFRGSVMALDAATGDTVWETFTIDEEPALTGKNSIGTRQYGPSGSPIWNSPAIDEKRNQLFVGTGENYSSPATATSDAIIAMDLDTGAINWVSQTTAGDVWNMSCEMPDRANCPEEDGPDFDYGAGTMIGTLDDGREIVMAGQKSGDVYGFDPETGDVIWGTKVGRGGIQGGVHFSLAYDGSRLFVPISDMGDGKTYDEEKRPGLYAIDPANGEVAWETLLSDNCGNREFCDPGISAAISAIPGVVFAGSMDGVMRAFDSATGEILWSYDSARDYPDTLTGIKAQGGSFGGGSGPVVHNGRLYANSGYGIYFHMPGNVLLMFEPDAD